MPTWLLVGLAMFVVSLFAWGGVLVWHIQRVARIHRTLGLPGPPMTSEAIRNEVSSLVHIGWLRLLRARASQLVLPDEPQGRPVALIHGYWDQAASFWVMRDHLANAGRPTVGIELGFLLGDLHNYTERLVAALHPLVQAESDGVDVVAHSMGGIVLRMALRDHPDLRAAVRNVVTLGTPHHGTAAAEGFDLLPEPRAMQPTSELLANLPQLSDLVEGDHVTTIGGDFDMIVFPVDNTLDRGGHTHVIPAVGHGALLTDPRILDLVTEALSR